MTIPKDVRDSLQVEVGDKLLLVVDGDKVVVYPVRKGNLRELRGVFKGRAPCEGKEAQRNAACRAVVKHVMKVSGMDVDSAT
mgnify:CR=1 FL=1